MEKLQKVNLLSSDNNKYDYYIKYEKEKTAIEKSSLAYKLSEEASTEMINTGGISSNNDYIIEAREKATGKTHLFSVNKDDVKFIKNNDNGDI